MNSNSLSLDEWSAEERARVENLARRLGSLASPAARVVAVRAPGRVNLIGEHTDYSGLPVFPAAIDRSTIVVATPRDDGRVELYNQAPEYPARSYRLERRIPPYAGGDWGNYHKAAVQGVIDHMTARGWQLESFSGATMIVDGRVPLAAGLSSSAALSVASALAFMALNRIAMSPLETAELVAGSERYVGTMAGGMDQAASLLGEREHALYIEFRPLRVRPIAIPTGAVLIIANSLEVADKSGRVQREYNRRVVECGVAARILGKELGLAGVRLLGDIVGRVERWEAGRLLERLAHAAPVRLESGLSEAASLLGLEREMLERELFGDPCGQVAFDAHGPLEILRRARHVLSETERVAQAAAALAAGRLEAMGELMNASHESLRADFEVSTAGLDRMVEIARRAGALGARLTGAGFGGSIVALCGEASAPSVIAELDRGYYQRLSTAAEREQARTMLRASVGARVIELTL